LTHRGDLFRLRSDDPEYIRQAEAEAQFWHNVHPSGLETLETMYDDSAVDRYTNERFTGDQHVHWEETIARYGAFRRGLVLGTSGLTVEARILESNPQVHLTFLDISEGALRRRQAVLGAKFPGRVATQVVDLNFVELDENAYDLVVSSSTLHHVTNLEHLAYQINRALAPAGLFFYQDYVGEPRFQFSPEKKRTFEAVYNREIARQPGRTAGLIWMDTSDLSPLCGVRADEALGVFRTFLTEVQLRTAGALLVPLGRVTPADTPVPSRPNVPTRLFRYVRRRLPWRRREQPLVIERRFLDELILVGDLACDAGLLKPGTAFAVYRKRTEAAP
jgi:SAM-dependent methyltransferase